MFRPKGRLLSNMNFLTKRIGIIGGGQLGRMMIEESLRYNIPFNVLEADPNCPCAPLAQNFIEGSLMDGKKIRELAVVSEVLTYEIEHVNTEALLELESEGKEIIPSDLRFSNLQFINVAFSKRSVDQLFFKVATDDADDCVL